MTKKHFEEIARTLNLNFAPLALVLDFSDMCEAMNPRFDRHAFIEAATVNLRKVAASEARMLDRALKN